MKKLTITFHLKDNTLDKRGTYKLYCRVSYYRKSSEFALPYRLRPDEWNKARERAHEDEPLNEELVWIEAKLMELKRQLTYEGKEFTANDIVRLFLNRKPDEIRLAAYIQKFVGKIVESGQHKDGTKRAYLSRSKVILAFLEAEGKMGMSINELQEKHLQRFDVWMSNRKSEQYKTPYKRSHINKIHKTLITMMKQAKREGLISENPYEKFYPLPKDTSPPQIKYLNDAEMEVIARHDLGGNESLKGVRDFFVFCCYTGLRFGDAKKLEKGHVRQETYKGKVRNIIEIVQEKTGNPVTIPLFGLAETLYQKQLKSDICQLTGRLFVPVSNVKVNAFLKVIGDMCGIGKKLHHHMARHTAGTFLLSRGMPEAHVAAILGHTDTSMTRKYAKILKNSLLDRIDDIESRL